MEIEEIVPRDVYFASLASVHNLSATDACAENFDQWLAECNIKNISRRAFSKKVDLWLNEVFDFDLDKPRTMLHAVGSVDLKNITHIDVFRQLLDSVRTLSIN